MCTAVSVSFGTHYFGRNLDLEYGFQEQVVITPRNFSLPYRRMPFLEHHYALIGVATISEGYPLYYDATNEKGLSMAGLYFPGPWTYQPPLPGKENIASFEFIPWVLGQCCCIEEVRRLLQRLHITNSPFSTAFVPQSLHWMIADRYESLVVEPTSKGLVISENPVGVLTNAPGFDYHLHRLADFQGMSVEGPRYQNAIPSVPLPSGGMGAMGLPGDYSSGSRFIKAAFTAYNSNTDGTETSNAAQFFHILSSVSLPRGCVKASNGEFATTRYSSCCNTDKGIYYYTTYDNSRITAVELRRHNLNGRSLTAYPLRTSPDFFWET